MPEGLSLRSVDRRVRAGASHGSSCDLLVELAEHEPVALLLAEVGVRPEALAELSASVRDELEPEPADWHLRLQQRGGRPGPGGSQADFDQLLAIVRSADCHAYRLLQLAGVDPALLRKRMIERVRERGSERVLEPIPSKRPTMRMSKSAAQPIPQPTDERGSLRRAQASSTRPAPPSPRQSIRGGRAIEPAPTPARPSPAASASPKPSLRPQPKPQPQVEHEERATNDEPSSELRSIDRRKLPPMVGRERELAMLADALLRRGPRPPLLVGEHGSGRTLLATHLAGVLEQPVFRLEAPSYADDEALAEDLEAIAAARGVVVLDDLDRVASDTPPPLLPALARTWATGSPRMLTVLSHEGRARLEAWMPGILDTLDVLLLRPLEAGDVHRAVELASASVLEQHGVALTHGAHLSEPTRIADRFLAGGLAMPGRALDLLDLACARCIREGRSQLDRTLWLDIVCDRTGLSRNRVEGTGERDMLDLDAQLARQVVGHEHVLETLAALIRRNRACFSSGRPIASVLLLGPSGVGKTEIAKALASSLFERDDALLRLDMSEYAESHAVARVVGAPPGYVGHEQGGALTDPLIRNPHRVVLLDEIEKSHRDVHQLLLQVFDEGRLTDGRGRTVDFRHAVVIMTSNLGAELMNGGGRPEDDEVLTRARAHFPVELWNRIEAPLVLRPLTRAQMLAICRRLISVSSARLAHDRGIRYRVDDEVVEHLIDRAGIDPALGARPLRHLLGREVESLLADAILRGRVRAGEELVVKLGDDQRLELSVGR